MKIGITNNPQQRFTTLTCSNGTKLEYMIFPTYIARLVEKVAHSKLGNCRKHGEWFSCTYENAISVVNVIMDSDDYKRRNYRR